ncbi:MAG: molybdopterin-synthase adenylyltransferase MoeB [Syntrophomonas sp.]|nr:molybdopterin-synthase adenylyltransferase MoeB [Syntrophomonas sp.]
MIELTDDHLKRYSRQIMISQIGQAGQQKLLQSKVLIIGSGGLGSPAAYYMAAAGVGEIGLVDYDQVDISNLQRQILHNTKRLGMLKVESAKQTLKDLNPDVRVNTYPIRVSKENAEEIISPYDIIVDAVDNYATRYLVNDICVRLKKPLVVAGVTNFGGLVMVVLPGQGPCYRCVLPEPPKPRYKNPSELGVIGTASGIIGTIEAMETIKLLLGVGENLAGRLLVFDGLGMYFQEIKVERKSTCPVCGNITANGT